MAVTIKDFLERFPEFDGQGKNLTLISAKFEEAGRLIDPVVWGDLADDGQLYLCGHLLANSPMGQAAKLVAKDGSTVYGKRYDRMARQVAMGYRVA